MTWSSRSVILATALVVAVPAARAQDMYIYPTRGQSQQQQDRDRYQCHGWAVQQTGFDPSSTSARPVAAPPPPQDVNDGSLLRSTGRGAAVGAIGGAIGGDAGKGAAIGAGVGLLVGGIRRAERRHQQEQAYQQQSSAAAAQNSAIAQGRTDYNRAMAACLQGRGYTVN
jgi:hypothetical protein